MTANARFRWFRAGLWLRPAVLILLMIVGGWRVGAMVVGAFPSSSQVYSMQSINIPFTVCKQSTTWTRPTAEQQTWIWNDSRYARPDVQTSYEWTHEFLLVPTDSTSIQYDMENEAGLWTEGTFGQKCDAPVYKHNEEWVQAWILLHRVRSIRAARGGYTITVEATAKGFQSIIFKRLGPDMTFRIVDTKGQVLAEVKN
jgi:hypothetical protein